MEIAVALRRENGGWTALASDPPVSVRAESREDCVRRVRDAVLARRPNGSDPVTVVVEVAPDLVGVAEAASILGWDKRRVITYVDRGSFPEPLARLAGGRVWARADVEAFRLAFLERQARRRRR
ncbi:MAG TPA: hypothetical protein VF058_04110 [Actinomycetota bacterium]